MAANPLLEERAGGPAAQMVAGLAGFDERNDLLAQFEEEAEGHVIPRKLSIYPTQAGFDLLSELEYLTWRSIEPNIFFHPRFLIPAMPRLDDRQVRLMVMRDENEEKSRLRFLMPYTVERPGFNMSAPIIRAWATQFAPQGSPLIDRDDPAGVIEDLFSILGRPHLKLPEVMVLPEMRVEGPAAKVMRSVAISRGLPLMTIEEVERPFLERPLADGDEYLREALGSHHRREYRRQWRKLAERGSLTYEVGRSVEDIRRRFEEFLALEAAGWKGRRGTAMAVDRYQAAFAREAVNSLAERDLVRIHTLDFNGKAIAILVVFVESGEAWTWKTAFDESFREFSPGALLMIELLKNHLDDPNIVRTDSCAVPDHPVVSRLFLERHTIATLIVGLHPGADHAVRQTASQIHLYRQTRNIARIVRNRLRQMTSRR
jgi:hypothetical protein